LARGTWSFVGGCLAWGSLDWFDMDWAGGPEVARSRCSESRFLSCCNRTLGANRRIAAGVNTEEGQEID
jgi:hypothetical protein